MIIAYDPQPEKEIPYNGFFHIGGTYHEENDNDFVFRIGDRVRMKMRNRVHWGDGEVWNTRPYIASAGDSKNITLMCDRIGTLLDIQKWCETREGSWDEAGFTRYACRALVEWDDGEVEKIPYVSWLYPETFVPDKVILVPPAQWGLGLYPGLSWK